MLWISPSSCCRRTQLEEMNQEPMQGESDLFIYGTLLPGLELEDQTLDCTRQGPVLLKGADLYDLGAFPGIKLGQGSVIGEWLKVPPESLTRLDRIEGYHSSWPESQCTYLRRPVEVLSFQDGHQHTLETYLYNLSVDSLSQIEHGCYRRYREEQEVREGWIIAFGSNLSQKRLEDRVGKVTAGRPGWVPDFSLVFNKRSLEAEGLTYANLRFALGQQAPAIAWWLSERQIQVLDQYEGVPTNYLRTVLPFVDRDNPDQIEYQQAYLAHPDQLAAGQPAAWYREHLEVGYREHGLGTLTL